MPLDVLPASLQVPTRQALYNLRIRAYQLRNPSADVSDGSPPSVDAYVDSDVSAPLFAEAITISLNTSRQTRTGAALDDDAKSAGTARLPAEGSGGAIIIQASSGGVTLLAGQQGTINGLRYAVTATATYQNGAQVPVSGIDTGPLTVQPAGTIFTWTNPPPGLGPTGIVAQQTNGQGLSGGHAAESDDDLRDRLDELAANPPASGNDAQYQATLFAVPGLTVQQPFTYPSICGTGTIGLAFTLLPAQPGGNRIPSATQNAATLAWVRGQMPADDVPLMCTIVPTPVVFALKITWTSGIASWTDATPWPPYETSLVEVLTGGTAVTPTATTFTLTNIPSGNPPQAGQSIAFLDLPNQTYRRKKILTATLNADAVDYDIVVDTTLGVSDTSYTPASGQACCPWSDSLSELIVAIIGAPSTVAPGSPPNPTFGYFDLLGPGEQVASFWDPGLRERRSPPDPSQWPSTLTFRALQPLYSLDAVEDVQVYAPSLPFATPVGTPGVSSNLLTLGTLLAFP